MTFKRDFPVFLKERNRDNYLARLIYKGHRVEGFILEDQTVRHQLIGDIVEVTGITPEYKDKGVFPLLFGVRKIK